MAKTASRMDEIDMDNTPITLTPRTKLYVATPANIATGGAHDLHQFAYDVQKLFPQIKVYMFYSPADRENPAPPEYAYFNLPLAREIEDKEDNVLVFCEGHTLRFRYLKHIKMALWWLSVENYYTSQDFLDNSWVAGKINRLLAKLKFRQRFFFDKELARIPWHFAQSYYAYQHFKSRGAKNMFPMTDYIHSDYTSYVIDKSIKENIVAYNPKKGLRFSQRLIKACPNIKFVPIERMSRAQIIDLLKRTKVYIDFGNHPGRDLIPREAASLGCCMITGKRGTAKYFEDISISDRYKFDEHWWTIPRIRERIEECLKDYDARIDDFEEYRARIRRDPQTSIENIRAAFTFVGDR